FVDRCVHDPLGQRFLATLHHRRNEAGNRWTPIAGIDVVLFFVNSFPSRHRRLSYPILFLLGGGFLRSASASTSLRTLRPVFGAATPASIHAQRVERSAHNVIADTRQILHASPPHKHDRVLLQIMPLARNVGNHFLAVRQPHFCHFAQRRIRLLRSARHHLHAHATPLWRIGQRR